jgi:hypothetical protein
MDAGFQHDVFLSHSSKDKAVVRAVAERLRADGLRVWFDEWEIKPGDSIPAKIEEGLEHSRVLVLCMSANAFGSDPAAAGLESQTFRFRDPLNSAFAGRLRRDRKERRFIPLRLDDTPIKGSLERFQCIRWCPAHRAPEPSALGYPSAAARFRFGKGRRGLHEEVTQRLNYGQETHQTGNARHRSRVQSAFLGGTA